MAIKEVRQYWVVTCDCCGTTKEVASRSAPMDWVEINVGQAATDFQGNAVADASVHLSLCRECGIAVVAGMNAAIDRRRTGPPHPAGGTTLGG